MLNNIIFSLIGLLGTLSSIVSSYISLRHKTKKEHKKEGSLITELSYIKSSINSIIQKLELIEDKYINLTLRITKLEESYKHIRKTK
jgi:hypothetical protein